MSSEPKSRNLKIYLAASLTVAALTAGIATLVQSLTDASIHLQQRKQQQFEQAQAMILNSAKDFAAAGHYPECIAEAEKVQMAASVYAEAQSCRRNCHNQIAIAWLEQAKQRTGQGELVAAMGDASQVSPDSDYYEQAQQMIQDHSKQVLEIAESQYWQSTDQLELAVKTASSIPVVSPIYATVQKQIQAWQSSWFTNTQHLARAQQASSQEQWSIALDEAKQITDHPFWLPQKDAILQIAQAGQLEQQYEAIFAAAETLLEQNETTNAILTAQQLPDTFPWSERKQQLIIKAEAKQRQIILCQRASLGLLSCY